MNSAQITEQMMNYDYLHICYVALCALVLPSDRSLKTPVVTQPFQYLFGCQTQSRIIADMPWARGMKQNTGEHPEWFYGRRSFVELWGSPQHNLLGQP